MDSKRLAKISIGCTAAVLITTIILGWWAIDRARGVAKWSEKADGFPTVAELRGPAIPDDENAALVYEQAWEALELTEEQEDALWRSEDPEVLAPILEQNRESLRLLHEATGMEKCRFEPAEDESGFAERPYSKPMRRLGMLLRAETLVASSRSGTARGLDAVEARVRLADHLSLSPYGMLDLFLVASELSYASLSLQHVLADATPDADGSRSLRRALEDMELHEAFMEAYRVDVAEATSWLDDLLTGDVQAPDPKTRRTYKRAAASRPYRWLVVLNRAKYMELSRRRLDRAAKPWREVAYTDPILGPDNALYPWIQLLPPHFGMLPSQRDQALAVREMMLVALDIEDFIAEHGHPPESLDELIEAQGIDDADYAFDVFSVERLRYQPGEDGGYTLWSVGRDLDDDGGVTGCEAREAGRDADDNDIVFRVEPVS